MGTVATACVRKSMTDVLLVRDTQPQSGSAPFKTIVAAVDFSPTSLRAVARAAMFAAKDGAKLHLLHVFQAPWLQLHYSESKPLAADHQQKDYRDGLERRLAEFCRPALEAHAGLDASMVVYDYNGHRSGIVEYAGKAGAGLIVLGTRGQTNLRDPSWAARRKRRWRKASARSSPSSPRVFTTRWRRMRHPHRHR